MLYNNPFELPSELRGKKIKPGKVIPTVCSLKNVLNKLVKVHWNFEALKQWEKAAYKHYNLKEICQKLLQANESEQIMIIRDHILNCTFEQIEANPFDIYIVAYVSENIDVGKDAFVNYCLYNGLAGTENSSNAIYQVGKGDGIFLRILNDDGTVKDWEFMKKWLQIS